MPGWSDFSKVGVSRHPLQVIGIAIGVLVVLISYLIRIAEGPAHQPHSKYYWCAPNHFKSISAGARWHPSF
eukprot:1610361-Rhodomonas_salina.1